jgi:hypothetical protein
MTTQPQLLQIPLDPGDIVYTPDWVARDMVEFFKPSGRILEPCAGDGVFLKYLPDGTEWCEIERGRDFFAWTEPVDWVFGNPPYKILNKWMQHSYSLALNIVYIIPMNSPWNSMGRLREIATYGGMVHTRAYGNGSLFGKDYGFACGAIHFQREYIGPMYSSLYQSLDKR